MCSNCVMLLIWTKISEDFFWHFVPFMPERIKAFLWQKGKSNKVSSDCISTLCVYMLYIFTTDSPLNVYILVPVSGLDQEKTLTSISISLWVWTTPKAELQACPLMFPF